jgi:hypothetical protein
MSPESSGLVGMNMEENKYTLEEFGTLNIYPRSLLETFGVERDIQNDWFTTYTNR